LFGYGNVEATACALVETADAASVAAGMAGLSAKIPRRFA
jgi:hypothetical protein